MYLVFVLHRVIFLNLDLSHSPWHFTNHCWIYVWISIQKEVRLSIPTSHWCYLVWMAHVDVGRCHHSFKAVCNPFHLLLSAPFHFYWFMVTQIVGDKGFCDKYSKPKGISFSLNRYRPAIIINIFLPMDAPLQNADDTFIPIMNLANIYK